VFELNAEKNAYVFVATTREIISHCTTKKLAKVSLLAHLFSVKHNQITK